MKKVLVAFAVVAFFAACNDNTTSTEGTKKDSTGTTTTAPADTTKPAAGADTTKPVAGADTAKPAAAPADTAKKAK